MGAFSKFACPESSHSSIVGKMHPTTSFCLDVLIAPLAVAYTVNYYRTFLDKLCATTGTTVGITDIGLYPCGEISECLNIELQPDKWCRNFI